MRNLLIATLSATTMLGAAHAAPIVVDIELLGEREADTVQFADTATFVDSERDASDVVDGDLSSSEPLFVGTDLRVGFEDNVAFNGEGADLLVFEEFLLTDTVLPLPLTFPEQMWATIGDVTVAGTYQGTLVDVSVLPTDLNTTHVYSFDLGDFGLRPGETLTGDVLFSSFGLTPDIAEVLALNSLDPDAVPLPAAALLFGPMVAGGFAFRRKAKA